MPRHTLRRSASAAACCFALAVAAPADDAERAREGVRTGRYVSLTSILEQIESGYVGHAIEVELDTEPKGDPPTEVPTYEIEWLTPQGHVIEFEFDARTGKLLEIEGTGADEARRR